MNSCIHCGSNIDADRLEFLIDFNKPLTCKNCSMEQPAAGYKDKVKVVKSKTDAQIRKSTERLEQIKEKNKLWAKRELKAYKSFWDNVKTKRKNRR